MIEDFATALAWGIAAIALFSFASIAAWTSARQKEREAFYKSEAIKKLAEMQGTVSEPVLQVLRNAVATWQGTPSAAWMGPAQAKAYYKAETIKKLADMQGAGADAIVAVMREEERLRGRRVREGLKLAGFITSAVGIGVAAFLRVLVPEVPVYLAGFIPVLVGVAILGYAFTYAVNDGPVS